MCSLHLNNERSVEVGTTAQAQEAPQRLLQAQRVEVQGLRGA